MYIEVNQNINRFEKELNEYLNTQKEEEKKLRVNFSFEIRKLFK